MRTPTDPTPAIVDFEKRYKNGEAGALLFAAADAVAGLKYLAFLDDSFERRAIDYTAHNAHAVDMAHALWATGTCISAIDRCAAALARALCGYKKHHEVDAPELWSKRRKFRDNLPQGAVEWIDGVVADGDYLALRDVRRKLVHSRAARHFTIAIGDHGPPARLRIDLASSRVPVSEVVAQSFTVADRHVGALFDRLQKL